MLKFRGHHFICLNFFLGEGYSKDFVDNLNRLMERANAGEEIKIVEGADDVCGFCPSLINGLCRHDEEEIRKADRIALKKLGFAVGEKIKWEESRRRVKEISRDWLYAFCEGCYWEQLCEMVKTSFFWTEPKEESPPLAPDSTGG